MRIEEWAFAFNAQRGGCASCGRALIRSMSADGLAEPIIHLREGGLMCCACVTSCDCEEQEALVVDLPRR